MKIINSKTDSVPDKFGQVTGLNFKIRSENPVPPV